MSSKIQSKKYQNSSAKNKIIGIPVLCYLFYDIVNAQYYHI